MAGSLETILISGFLLTTTNSESTSFYGIITIILGIAITLVGYYGNRDKKNTDEKIEKVSESLTLNRESVDDDIKCLTSKLSVYEKERMDFNLELGRQKGSYELLKKDVEHLKETMDLQFKNIEKTQENLKSEMLNNFNKVYSIMSQIQTEVVSAIKEIKSDKN